MKPLRVLIIEDEERDAVLLTRELQRGGFNPTVRRVENEAELNAALEDSVWDLVLSDYRLPGFDGLGALKLVQAQGREVPFILVSGFIGEDQAVAALKAGANDFILKDKLARLVPAVERELREAEIHRQRRLAEVELHQAKIEWERTFDSVPDLIMILDEKHRVHRVNRALADRLRLTPEQCVQLSCAQLVHGAPDAICSCPHRQTVADGKAHAAEVYEPRLGGHFLVTTSPLRDAQDQVIGTVHVSRDITDRKRAETELRENQKRLLLAQQAGRVGVFDVNYQTRTCVWTNELKALFGLPTSYPATPDSWTEFVHPEDRETVKTQLQRAFQARRSELELTYRILRADGQVHWIENRALISYDEAGAAQRMIGTTTDITAYKQARQQLIHSERQLKRSAIVAVLTLAGAVYGVEALVMFALAQLPPLAVWQHALLDSTVLLLLASPILYYWTFRPIARALRERARIQEDLRQANEHLEQRVQERTASLEDANRKLEQEIAERQVAQSVLTETNRQKEEALARLDALFECAPMALGFWNKDLHSLRVNPALAQMNRLPNDTPQGWTPDQILPASDEIPALVAEWKRILATGQPQLNVEISGRTPAFPGEIRWYVGNWFPVRVQGEVIGLGATLLDITERRRAQDALRQAHDGLERQVQERTAELVATNAALRNEMAERRSLETRILEISEQEQHRIGQDLHDSLCQHLSGIAYLCNTVEQRIAQLAPAEEASLRRISELLREAIDQARGLARGLHPVENEADGLALALNSLAESCRNVYRISARFESPRPVLVENNLAATHLFRIAQEAVSNAARHGRASQIIIRLLETSERLTLIVKDNGGGLPANLRESKGLGLLTMQYRARSIGAEMQIQPVERGGTILTCSLPKPNPS